LGRHAFDFAFELFPLPAFDPLLFLGRGGHPDGGQGVRVAGNVAIQPQGELLGITFVVVDALVLFVQTDRLHDQIAHAHGHKVAVQPVAKGAGFIAAMHLLRQRELRLDPRQKLGWRELLCRLRGAVVQYAHNHDGVRVDVESQLEGLQFAARDLIRANFGGI